LKHIENDRYGLQIGLSLIILLFIVGVSWFRAWPGFVDRLELAVYDWKTQQYLVDEVDYRITIVEIGERSLQAEGSWPWPRERLAQLLTVLKEHYKVSAIGLDVFFPEAKNPVSDALLAQTITSTQTVLPMVFSQDKLAQGALGSAAEVDLQNALVTMRAQGYVANGDFMSPNYIAGHISQVIDVDGGIRKFTPLIEYQGQHYEALPIAMVRQLYGIDKLVVKKANSLSDDYRGYQFYLDEYNDIFLPGLVRIPIDEQGQALIPYTRTSGSFRYVSASDVLRKNVPIHDMVGNLVLIGATATGLHDLVATTPIASQLPGVEIHAHILAGLIDGRFMSTSRMEVQGEAVVMLLIALFFVAFVRNLSIIPLLAIMSALSITWFISNLIAWQIIGLNLPMLPPFLYLALLLIMNFVMNLQLSREQFGQLMKSFESYVPAVVAQASIDQTSQLLEATERPVTTMFFDLREFTAWSEQQSAQNVSEYVASVMHAVSNIVEQHDGVIDKYIGDSVMAFWDSGSCPRHAQRAVDAAIAIELHFSKVHSAKSKNTPSLDYGIGINSGLAMVGQLATEERSSYTVMGDVINVASRLQALSSTMGCHIILGDETVTQLEHIPFRSLGEVKLRGRHNTVLIHTPTMPMTQPS